MLTLSRERGFLPETDPLDRLPEPFSECDQAGRLLPDLLAAGKLREYARRMNIPGAAEVLRLDRREQILLMVRLSFLVSAYVYADAFYGYQTYQAPRRSQAREREAEGPVVVPRNIAVPFVALAQELGVPPILSYTFYALHNWARMDPEGLVAADNLRLLQPFLGGMDERGFILTHIEIEQKLAPGLAAIPEAQSLAQAGHAPGLAGKLATMAEAIEDAVGTMGLMPERCDPDIYYRRVRPYIFGFNLGPPTREVLFEGTAWEGQPKPLLKGETGAQTPSFPTLWAALGVGFPEDDLKSHVLELRRYLLPEHLATLEAVERGPSIRALVLRCATDQGEGHGELKDAYNRCIHGLFEFFGQLHQTYAADYIFKKETDPMRRGRGTGGTPHMRYLAHHAQTYRGYLVS